MTHYLTLDDQQARLIMDLIAPSIEHDADGNIDPDVNPDAANIAQQLNQAQRSDLAILYVSLYEDEQCYGGPEEGGWYYWRTKHIWTNASTDTDEIVTWWNSVIADLAGEAVDHIAEENWSMSTLDLSELLALCEGEHEALAPLKEAMLMHDARTRDTYRLVLELVPGSQVGSECPYYC